MAHENKSKEIKRISIERAENGYIYHACAEIEKEGYQDNHYVYESVDDVLAAVKDDLGSPHMREYSKEEAFKEVNENEPKVVGETRKKKGKEAARKQLTAIALNKSRGGLFKK